MSSRPLCGNELVMLMVLLCFVIAETAKGMRVFIFTKATLTKSATVKKNDQACEMTFTVADEEEHTVISTTRKKSAECSVTFTSDKSRLGMLCSKFYLKGSCSMESLKVDQGNGNITKYCGIDSPNLVSSGKSLSLHYKRQQDKNRNCNFGFICHVYSVGWTSPQRCDDNMHPSVIPQPALNKSEVQPSGRSFCSVCGWTVKLSKSNQTRSQILSSSLKKSNPSTTNKNFQRNKGKGHRKKKEERKEKTKGRKGKGSKGRRKQRDIPVQTRIVGGSEVSIEDYPWAVVLIKVSPEGIFSNLCGGSLITSSWIISAAHCFALTESPSEVMARLGTKHLPRTVEDLVRIVEIVLHPDFKPWETFSNDVSLVRLEEPIVFTSAMVPVCVANPADDPLPTNTTFVVGWGLTDSNGVRSAVLRAASLSIISLEECQTLYNGLYTISSVMLCAYTPGRDACQGDSGGGLVKQTSDRRWVIVGIVSFGKGCADANSPGVYARVSSFVSWINETIGNAVCS